MTTSSTDTPPLENVKSDSAAGKPAASGGAFSNTDFYDDPFAVLDDPDTDQPFILDPEDSKQSASRKNKSPEVDTALTENDSGQNRTFLQKHFVPIVGGGVAAVVLLVGFLQFGSQFFSASPSTPESSIDESVDVTAPVKVMAENPNATVANTNAEEIAKEADFGAFFDLEGADLRKKLGDQPEPVPKTLKAPAKTTESEVIETAAEPEGVVTPEKTEGGDSIPSPSNPASPPQIVSDVSSDTKTPPPQLQDDISKGQENIDSPASVTPKQAVDLPASPPTSPLPAPNTAETSAMADRLESLEKRLMQMENLLQEQQALSKSGTDTVNETMLTDLENQIDERLTKQNQDVQTAFTQQSTRIEMVLSSLEEKIANMPKDTKYPPPQKPNEPKIEKTAVSKADTDPKDKAGVLANPPSIKWSVQAASPGQAWIIRNGETRLRLVKAGDQVVGLGTVLGIEQTPKGWIVIGTQGRIETNL